MVIRSRWIRPLSLAFLVAGNALALPPAAQAETGLDPSLPVYDFVRACRRALSEDCREALRDSLVQIERDDAGRSICAPQVYMAGASRSSLMQAPRSLTDHVMLRLGAARLGRSRTGAAGDARYRSGYLSVPHRSKRLNAAYRR